MKTYKAHQPITLSSGKLALTKEQASSREYCTEKTKKGKNIYLIVGKVQFKKGEEFGYDGVIPKAQIEAVNADANDDSDVEDLVNIDRAYLNEFHPDLVNEIIKENHEPDELSFEYIEEFHPELFKTISDVNTVKTNNVDNIIEAIKLLDEENKDHLTEYGLPQVAAIEAVLESKVTADERNEAVEKISDMSALYSRLFKDKE